MKNNYKKPVAMILFLLSGLISLVFQVCWLKMLLPIFGNTVWAVATLLTAFMAGLALGSWWFGRIADKSPSPLRLYGFLEGFIGVYALFTLLIFNKLSVIYVPLYTLSGGDNLVMGMIKFLLAFLILLPPTVCMGATLPLLARQFTANVKNAGSGIGFLYTINTLGAVLGTFAAGFFLVPWLGLQKTVLTAAAVNFIILAVICLMTRGEHVGFKLEGLFNAPGKTPGKRWVMGVYFICGFTALAYEVIWNRILTLHLGSSVYAYSIMLAVYLLGITLGVAIMSYFIKRIKNPVRVFASIQLGLAFDLILLINQFGILSDPLGNVGEAMPGQGYVSFVLTLIFSTFQLLILPTLLMGASFPLAVRLFVKNQADLGKDTGRLYASNTVGTILGSFGAGFLLLPLLGAQWGLLVVASLNLGIAVFLLFKDHQSPVKKIVTVTAAILLFYGGYFLFTYKDQVILTAGVFRDLDHDRVKILAFEEDIYATVTVEERTGVRGKWLQLSMNGVNVAGTSSELFSIQKLQGHLPLLLHKNPQRVLHIGFGSGGTAWAVSRYPVEKITIAEISRIVIKKAARFFYPINHGVLNDPRVEVVFTDGRNKVLADRQTYDVILSDSIHPRFSGNGSLYTYDYYHLLKNRLRPGGLVSQWLPFYSITPENFKMIVKSFYRVFPHTSVWFCNNTINAYVIVIGKLDNGMIDYAAIERKLAIPAVAADLREINCQTSYKILDFFLFANQKVEEFVGGVPLHTDDNMAVEYLSGRALSRSLTTYFNYVLLLNHRTPVEHYLVNLEAAGETKEDILEILRRYWAATTCNLEGQRLFRAGRKDEAFEQFDRIPLYNLEDREPVEYFGSSYQQPFLQKTEIILN
ncbi:MAG: fused MFS/spermidine synthase [Candidatus Aminicenantes bacterium]|nr:MAG: fused MFS/spermidine synthase [Candidatus Aminicenantes bacterium]